MILLRDLLLSEHEVAPVMARLQDGNIEITALHNHLLNETPRVMTCISAGTATR
jgi:hypothetical protein